MKIAELDYDLPQELIAQHPAPERDSSRLMVVDRKAEGVTHRHFSDVASFLMEGDVLVINNSKVLPARLQMRRKTGGRLDVLLVSSDDGKVWNSMLNGRRLKEGEELLLPDGKGGVTVGAKNGALRQIIFGETRRADDVMREWGSAPLPPYIKRKDVSASRDEDLERYQTVYAEEPGSIAAPTAGLHFTDELLQDMKGRGISIVSVTLHVGAGTFLPIKTDDVEEHMMHSERYTISRETSAAIRDAKKDGRRIVAAGTTSCRVLETIGLEGDELDGETDLFVRPPYEFRMVDALLTNFHLPRSTLLLLVYAFGGTGRIRAAYEEAVREKYRFYSYGDAMLVI